MNFAMAMCRASWDDWDDDQYDPTTPEGADFFRHEAETGKTKDWVVIEGMTEEKYLAMKFGDADAPGWLEKEPEDEKPYDAKEPD
jgi:hypothetical protein